MNIRVMKKIPNYGIDGFDGKDKYEVMIDCLQADDLPITLGRQEMTFEGFEGIDPAVIFHVDGVRRHYKFRDPDENRPVRQTLGWSPPPASFIDATIYVRS